MLGAVSIKKCNELLFTYVYIYIYTCINIVEDIKIRRLGWNGRRKDPKKGTEREIL